MLKAFGHIVRPSTDQAELPALLTVPGSSLAFRSLPMAALGELGGLSLLSQLGRVQHFTQ